MPAPVDTGSGQRGPTGIERDCLLVVEGKDAMLLWRQVCRHQGLAERIQVLEAGGVTQLADYLLRLSKSPGFDEVRWLVVGRDAEADADAAFRSVCGALAKIGLIPPDRTFCLTSGTPRVGVAIWPEPVWDQTKHRYNGAGSLEDVCLSTLRPEALTCPNQFLACLESSGVTLSQRRKSRLHAYLAGTSQYVGLKIGEAARAGAWDFEHAALAPYRELLASVLTLPAVPTPTGALDVS